MNSVWDAEPDAEAVALLAPYKARPKEAAEPGIPDPLERPRPSVRQALKEIRAEQKQRAEDKARENAGRQKPVQHKAPPKKKIKKQKER